MPITDYFQYEADLGRRLAQELADREALKGKVLDVGCGYGGILLALKEKRPDIQALGLDRDPAMVDAGRQRLSGAAELLAADFFHWKNAEPFDLILMRDVLEHIGRPEEAMQRAASLLKPGGFLYASFAPFFGPFGGHQHNGAGFFSRLPWIQCLPEPVFRRMLTVRGNAYKAKNSLDEDMDSVLATRLTMRRFDKAAHGAGLRPVFSSAFLSRPDYRIKFGWPEIRLPKLSLLMEFFATGVETLLQKSAAQGEKGSR